MSAFLGNIKSLLSVKRNFSTGKLDSNHRNQAVSNMLSKMLRIHTCSRIDSEESFC